MPKEYVKEYYAFGEWHTITEWSRITGISRTTIYNRLDRLPDDGTFEDVLEPVKKPRIFDIGGEKHTLSEWCKITGIPWNRMHTRVNRLKPEDSYEKLIADVFTTPEYEAFGEKHTISEWSEITEISKATLYVRLRNKKKDESFESILAPVRKQVLYEAHGETHTLTEWSRITKIGKGKLIYRVKNAPEGTSFEEILDSFGDNYHNRGTSSLTRFAAPIPMDEIKRKYENDPESKFKWMCFSNYLRKNPFCREFLRNRQNGLCPVCRKPLDDEKTWMHFLDCDCLCTFTNSEKQLISISYPSKRDQNRREKVPNCEMCMLKKPEQFDKCMSKYILVHGPCNELIFKETHTV